MYIIENFWPTTKLLAISKSEKDGKAHPLYGANQYESAKVFGATYSHSNEALSDPVSW